jgi:hypothetical protein
MNEFVYLNSLIPNINELQLNDVGHITFSNDKTLSIFFIRINKELLIPKNFVTSFEIQNTGDRFDYKVCDRCFKRLNTNVFFENNSLKKDNVITKRPSCKFCRKIKNGKSIPKSIKDHWENKRPKDYTLHRCPICNKTNIVGVSLIVLDHCHRTGKVRGYLCESCNTGIGRFDDDVNLVQRAKEWLEKPL